MWYIFSSIGNSYSCHPFSVCVVSYSDNCYDWIYFHDSCHRLWTVRNCYKWYIILFFSKDYILLNYFWRARSFFKHIKTRIPPRCREKRVKLKKKKVLVSAQKFLAPIQILSANTVNWYRNTVNRYRILASHYFRWTSEIVTAILTWPI